MSLWFAILIPFAVCVILMWLCYKDDRFPQGFVWIPIVMLPCAFIIGGLHAAAFYSQTSDTEYWTGWVTHCEFHEQWTEEWDETVIETDDKGRTHTRTVHHVEHHPPQWYAYINYNTYTKIDRTVYKQFKGSWGNEKVEKPFRFRQTSWGDGRVFTTKWNNKTETMVIFTEPRTYVNKIQCSASVFNYRKISSQEASQLGLFDYPDTRSKFYVPSILGISHPEANRKLCVHNALLGSHRQVRMWVLVYDNTDVQIALDQESYWCGGNKNDFVLCIGVKNNEVQWAYPFSWCEDEKLKVDVKQYVQDQKELDLNKIVDYMSEQISGRFCRKQFTDFDYLGVEIPFSYIAWNYGLVILACCIVCGFFFFYDWV